MPVGKTLYLFLALGLFLPSIYAYWFLISLRKQIILFWFLGAGIGVVADSLWLRDYWHPDTIFRFGIFSVESIIAGAGLVVVGATIYSATVLRYRYIHTDIDKIQRNAFLGVLSLVALIFLAFLGLNSMMANYIVLVCNIAYLNRLNSVKWKESLVAGVLLLITAVPLYVLLFGLIDKTYISQHFVTAGYGVNPILCNSMPLSELIWYVLWGMAMQSYFRTVCFRNGQEKA